MTTRIAHLASNNQLVGYMLRTQARLQDTQVQVSSEKVSQTYSGLARDSERLVKLENQTQLLYRYKENNEQMDLQLQTMTTIVEGIKDTIKDFREQLFTFSGGSLDAEERVADVQQAAFRALTDMQVHLNTDFNGKFLFSGASVGNQPIDLNLSNLANFQAAYDATRYLLDNGHRRIAHIAGALAHDDAAARRDGYVCALEDAGIAVNDDWIIEGDFLSQSGLLAVEMLFTRGALFSAIFAANDQMAAGARLALHRRGIRVPQDVTLIGFDNVADAAYMIPPLTTVNQPAAEMGETAANAMLQLLKGKAIELPVFTTELVLRESVARLP